MFCSECGKQIADDAKFCGECGAAQINTTAEQAAKSSEVIQNCPSCNTKGWERGKQCRSCGYTNAEDTATSNNSQASLTNTASSDINKFLVYVLGAVFVIGIAASVLFSNSSVNKTETAQAEQEQAQAAPPFEQKDIIEGVNGTESTELASNKEKLTQSTIDVEKEFFRTGGAWVRDYNIGNLCSDLILNSDNGVSFYTFANNSYRMRLRIGKRNSALSNPNAQVIESMEKLDNLNVNIQAQYKFENNNVIVDFKTADGDAIREQFRYISANDVFEKYSQECLNCSIEKWDQLKNRGTFNTITNGGTEKYKFCNGSYE